MSDSDVHDPVEGIAIIGMSGRFPGANSISDFWRNLCAGVESISQLSNAEMEAEGWNSAFLRRPNLVKACPVLDDITSFDAAFFGYTPREAELIDPQQRLFLECAWEALEQAGYDSETYTGWIGVYGGIGTNGYKLYNLFDNPEIRDMVELSASVQATTANERDYVTTRVSYKLNLKGPSFNVQCACSTALVAVHLACQGLLNYQCDLALAGGASVRVPHRMGYLYQEGGMYSSDGHCRSFDANASGTVFGSGVGVVVLKRLADAIADGDCIYAVIKGSAINNDGSLKVGFTAPAMEGQAEVIAMAQLAAGVEPEQVGYIEAHGTATPMGDPIEVAALTKVFRASTQKKGFCAIGSVKTNIGHASAAAGIMGLIKTALVLKHRQIPPSLHFRSPNPKIDFANSPFFVNTTLREWESDGAPRRAGVSSFGVGGTNAHVVLEEAPPLPATSTSRPYQLLLLSARSATALEAATTNLLAHLKEHPEQPLADVAYTLQIGRRGFAHRRMLVCWDRDDAIATLDAGGSDRIRTLTQEPRERPIAFMFSGQGAQYVNMAREIYETGQVFREHVDHCAALLKPHLGLDLCAVIFDEGRRTKDQDRETRRQGDKETPDLLVSLSPGLESGGPLPTLHPEAVSGNLLDQTQYAQPALFVIEYALAQLWMSWGVRPQAMIGHSIGEYVAACLAGVFRLEDALALVAARGRLMQALPAGAMLSVPLAESQVRPLLGAHLSLAAINGPARCVVAGPADALDELKRRLSAQEVDCRRLQTSHAFHSWMMEPVLEPFVRQVQAIRLAEPSIPYLSNVTGTWIRAEEATDPSYWAQHLRQTVRFGDGLRELLREPGRILLEVGPGRTLSMLAQQHPDKTAEHSVLASLRHPQDQQPDTAFVLNTLGQLWLAGVRVDWPGFYAHERRQRLALPTYPFERQRYWIDPPKPGAAKRARTSTLDKKPDIANWFYIPSWKRSLPPVAGPASPAEQALRWVVFRDAHGLGAQLAARLEQAGRQVVSVLAGVEFGKLDERTYALNPERPEDYRALLSALRESQGTPQRIAHLWNVTASEPPAPRDERYAQARLIGFYSLLFLAQALGSQDTAEPMHIGVVSNNMQKVAGEAALEPEKALLLGPCKVIPQEYPNVSCQSIDIVLPEPGASAPSGLIDQLLAELATAPADRVVAYRDYDRWVQSIEAVRLGEALEGKTRLREGGVYLITGGLGGIGLVLAEYLAQAARAKLILTGRSAFPAREAWAQWLETHGERDGVSQKIRKLQALESLGAEVLVLAADAANQEQMRTVVAQVYERFGALHGVVHAAGIAGGGLIQLKTPALAERVLAPKVTAVQVLETVLADAQLDFLVLCSSIVGVAGGVGQVDYCAANAFLDAYACYNTSKRGIFTISINWDAWQEVGMAVDTAAAFGLGDAAHAGASETGAHPLLDRRVQKTPAQVVYMTQFHGASHWALAEHKIMGTPTLPGTTYLEMARAIFQDRQAGAAELHDVFFLTPLMVAPDEHKEVHTICEEGGETMAFRVLSRLVPNDSEERQWQEHVRGKIRPLATANPARYDLAEIVGRCSQREISITAEHFERAERLVYWGPRWRSLKNISIGTGEALALIELPGPFAADLEEFGLHPALLDVATAFGSMMAEDDASYLPLSYRRLRINRSLPGTIYSYTRRKSTAVGPQETISFDVTIMDERGEALVEIEDFTMKRVSGSAASLRAAAPREQLVTGQHTGNGAEQPSLAYDRERAAVIGILSNEGVEAFRRILSGNTLPQIIVSVKDFPAMLERANERKQARLLETLDLVQQHKPAYARPEVQTVYVAPRNTIELQIADIWQSVFGIEKIGVHDNFFELGGDSVLAVQIIARATDAGFGLTPGQLFQHQTIAQLAEIISPGQVPAPAAEPVPVPVPPTPFQDQQAIEMKGEDIEDVYTLSPIQQGLLFHNLYAPGTEVYFEQFSWSAQEAIDVPAFERAWQYLVERHAILRTSFHWEDLVEPLQMVHQRAEMPLQWHDWRGLARAEQAARLEQLLLADRHRVFDLATAPLMRVTAIRMAAETYQITLSYHHLLLDGWSEVVLSQEFVSCYEAFCATTDPHLKPARPYRDYIAWLGQQDLSKAEQFWRQTLQGLRAPTPLGVDRAPGGAPDPATEYDLQSSKLPADSAAALQTLARQQRLTLNTLVQGAWALLLSRYSGADDVVFGVTTAGRPYDLSGVESMVGVFINTLPLRVRVPPDAVLQDWLGDLQLGQTAMRQYEYSPLWRVHEWSEVPRELPLFESIVVFENFPSSPLGRQDTLRVFHRTNYPLTFVVELGETLTLRIGYERRRFDAATIARLLAHLQLLLEGMVQRHDWQLAGLPLLTEAERQQLLVEWNDTLREVRSQKSEVRRGYPASELLTPESWLLTSEFEVQVERTPDAVAVVFDQRPTTNYPLRDRGSGVRDREGAMPAPDPWSLTPDPWCVTYAALNRRANQLAHWLQALGVGLEARVGVCLVRSPELVIALLGTLKAGAAYLPLDPALPPERLSFMLDDAAVSALITTNDQRPTTNDQRPTTADEGRRTKDEQRPDDAFLIQNPKSKIQNPVVVCLDTDWDAIARQPLDTPDSGVSAGNLAYVIYTSGSLGWPKGVLGTHRGMLNRFGWMWATYPFTDDDVCCQKTALSFVDSLWELLGPLLQGIRLIIIPDDVLRDPQRFVRMLAETCVTRIVLVPALLRVLLDTHPDLAQRLPRLRYWVSSGEALNADLCRRFYERLPQHVLLNLYGASEVAADATWYDTRSGEASQPVPIGRPLANTQIYLLDAALRPVPIGVAGELYVGGVQLARGYLGRPDLTAERFIPNPFAKVSGVGCRVSEEAAPNTRHLAPDTRLYKTGDLARYRPDGSIEFLGRVDHQVKLRGFRIELGEIEAALLQHAAVQQAVVVVHADATLANGPPEQRLVAYVVTSDELRVTSSEDSSLVSELRRFLQAQLPAYMLPAVFVVLDALPLTPSGKLDRRALPPPDGQRPELATAFVAPRTELEQTIAAVWQAVLQLDQVSIDDNFFELGGHSLLLVQVHGRLQASLQRNLSMVDLFRYPTIHLLAKHVYQEARAVPTAEHDRLPEKLQAGKDRLAQQRQHRQRALKASGESNG